MSIDIGIKNGVVVWVTADGISYNADVYDYDIQGVPKAELSTDEYQKECIIYQIGFTLS